MAPVNNDNDWIVEPADDEWVVEPLTPVGPSIQQQQANKYPTAAELGGHPGQATTARMPWLPDLIGAAQDPTGNWPTKVNTGMDNPAMALIGGAQPSASEYSGFMSGVKESPIGAIANKAGRWVTERADATRLWNKAGGVPAGRKGVQVSMETGEPTTNPGNAMVRQVQKEGKGPIGQAYEAMTARPNKVTQARSIKELRETGDAVRSHLSGSNVDIKIELPDTPKALQAAKTVGLTPGPDGSIVTKPMNAHTLQSALGDRINWNPEVNIDSNELMKDTFFHIKDQLENGVPGFKPISKPWQESYLFNKALRHQLELQEAGRPMPPSAIGRTISTVARKSKYPAAIIGGSILGSRY